MTENRVSVGIPTCRCNGTLGGSVRSHLKNMQDHGQENVPIVVSDQSPESLNLKNSNYTQLKELAKEIRIPVVGISQLSRAPEKGRGKPIPQLSDLRESGAIEQDADVVIFIYRPEIYAPDDENVRGIAEINVAKQRNGPTGRVNLAFIREYARFADMEFQTYES